MKIILLDGNANPHDKEYQQYLTQYKDTLITKKNEVTIFTLRDLKIKYCTGCWSCWWRTPGECIFKDDTQQIYKAIVHSDLLVFISPLIMGFVSSHTKKINDRLIPLLHPYITIVNGECHHKKRYSHYPDIGLVIKEEQDTDEEDLIIVKDIYRRFALNFRSRLKFFKIMDHNIEEVIDETCFV